MFILTTIANMQVFSMSEFNFCYNYVFYEPFEEKTTINLNSPFEFENGAKRNKCSRTDNSLFRSVNQSTFSITIDSEFDLNQQPFSLFFFVWTNVTIVDTQINMRLTNSGHDFAFLVATVPEYSVSILGSSFEFTSKDVTSFFGVANNLTEPLTVNRSSFSFDCSGPMTKFHGIAGQVNDLTVLNSSFVIEAKAVTSCGFVSLVLGQSTFKNLTVSGHLTGDNTVGFIFENKGACAISNITFSLVTSGSAVNCGFVNSNSGSKWVTVSDLTFVGFQDSYLISNPGSFFGTCPCLAGASLQRGLCYCVAGSIPTADSCKCQTKNAFIKNGACACWTNAVNTSNECVCPAGHVVLNGECVSPCPADQVSVEGVCKCKTANAVMDSSKNCVCVSDATNNTATNTCECPSDSVFDSTSQTCACPKYAEMKNSVCVCSQTLLRGSSMKNGQCACPVDTQIELDECKCTTKNAILSNGICACGPNAFNQSNICTTCPSGSQLINGVCEKQCPAGQVSINGKCECSTTNAVLGSKGKCVCPFDQVNNTVTNACECPINSIYDEDSSSCVCQIKLTEMVNKECKCSASQLRGSSLINGKCTCPVGSTQKGTACKCANRATLVGTQCKCTENQIGGSKTQGNFWCPNANKCCTKEGPRKFYCDGDYFQTCSGTDDVVE
ncbi:Conserved_hypothetical protein [Hexamita inflata]|uniref:Uncharacterized protein n=1 Tax=Hexamita inflata TaxID=28002 RepID=A0AA86U4M8_9EUKA|nr:Conserved hypothetical protein [Hexamita inflata]